MQASRARIPSPRCFHCPLTGVWRRCKAEVLMALPSKDHEARRVRDWVLPKHTAQAPSPKSLQPTYTTRRTYSYCCFISKEAYGTKGLSNLPEVTQLCFARAKHQIQISSFCLLPKLQIRPSSLSLPGSFHKNKGINHRCEIADA